MAPFYGWGSTASRLEPLWGGSLLFTTKFPEIPGTHESTNQTHSNKNEKQSCAPSKTVQDKVEQVLAELIFC